MRVRLIAWRSRGKVLHGGKRAGFCTPYRGDLIVHSVTVKGEDHLVADLKGGDRIRRLWDVRLVVVTTNWMTLRGFESVEAAGYMQEWEIEPESPARS